MVFKKIIIIINPLAGKGANRSLKSVNEILTNKGFEVIIRETSFKGHGEQISREIATDISFKKDTLVISAGGDGTYNEVANGLVYSSIPMAILPLGTTSVLARELLIPFNLGDAIRTILEGTVVDVNLGFTESLIDGKQRYFLLMAGIGFDAETVKNVDIRIKRYLGQLSYIISGIKTFITNESKTISVKVDGQKDISCSNIIICKSARYGGSFIITPEANLLSPYLSCFLTKGTGRLNLIKYIFGIVINQHNRFKDVNYLNANDLLIRDNGAIQIDGDYIGNFPVKVSVAQKVLRLVVSQSFVSQQEL